MVPHGEAVIDILRAEGAQEGQGRGVSGGQGTGISEDSPKRADGHVGALGYTSRKVFSVWFGFWGPVPIHELNVLERWRIMVEKRRWEEKGLRAHGKSLAHIQKRQC